MNDHLQIDGNTRAGTIGGTLVVVLLNLFTHDLFRSAILAFVGATVSFFVSFGWKYLVTRLRTGQRNKENIDRK